MLAPVTPNAKKQAIGELYNKGGVEQVLYGARHTFFFRLAHKCILDHSLRKIMGHRSIQKTQIYLDAIYDGDFYEIRIAMDL